MEQLAQCQIEREREIERAADAQRRLLEVKREQQHATTIVDQCRSCPLQFALRLHSCSLQAKNDLVSCASCVVLREM